MTKKLTKQTIGVGIAGNRIHRPRASGSTPAE